MKAQSSKRLRPILLHVMLPVLTLCVVSLWIFSHTVTIRAPWFGTLAESHHQYLSAHTVLDAKSWYREGPWNLFFGSFSHPGSIEFPTLESRGFYPSYPPGYILPIYLTGLITGNEPNVSTLMNYNLANHLFIALILSLTVFVFMRQMDIGTSASVALSLSPIVMELLLPGPLYWHQPTFFADQAVLLPFALFIFLEVVRDSLEPGTRSRTLLGVCQGLVLFYGFLTDWLFVFVSLVVYAKRLSEGEMGRSPYSFVCGSLKYWSGALVALSLFAAQLFMLGGFSTLFRKFLWRASVFKTEIPLDRNPLKTYDFFDVFWGHHIPYNFGEPAPYILWASLILLSVISFILVHGRYIRGEPPPLKVRKTLNLISMFLVPCFLQIYFLKQHSLIHLFSALKFSLPMAVVPFVLIPVLAWVFLESKSGQIHALRNGPMGVRRRVALGCIALFPVILAVLYVQAQHPRYPSLFPKPNKAFDIVGPFIDQNTGWSDVVFSPHSEVPERPQEWLSYTMKRIYRIGSVNDLYGRIRGLQGDYVVNIFVMDAYRDRISADLWTFMDKADSVRREGSLALYKFSKNSILRLAPGRPSPTKAGLSPPGIGNEPRRQEDSK
ncbi:MAG: hypothetical protein V1792_13115 [Pseudomonadota bacterium]